jgi:hypothetical protein
MHHLEETIRKYNAKLVIISDIAGFFLDKDIPDMKLKESSSSNNLSFQFCQKKTIVIATYPQHRHIKKYPSKPKHAQEQMLFYPEETSSAREFP